MNHINTASSPGGQTLTVPPGGRGEPLAVGEPVFRWTMAVRWADLDADGRVNNTVVLRYCEEARMQWLTALGLADPETDRFPVLAGLSCQYANPVRYPCDVAVDVFCLRVGRSSMDVVFHVRASDESLTYAVVRIAWIWVDRLTERPAEVPAVLRAALASP